MLVVSPLFAVSLSLLQLLPPAQANTSAICSTIFSSHPPLSSPVGTPPSGGNTTVTTPPHPGPTTICGPPPPPITNITSRPISTTVKPTTKPISTTIRTSVTSIRTSTPLTTIHPSFTSNPVSTTLTVPNIAPTSITPIIPQTPPGSSDPANVDNNDPAPTPPTTGGSVSTFSIGSSGVLLGVISVGLLLSHML